MENRVKEQPKSASYCKFYVTKKGCRAGNACPFVHDGSASATSSNSEQTQTQAHTAASSNGPSSHDLTHVRRFLPPPVPAGRVVSKPVPKAQTEDPREFQIKQLKRRFSPTETNEDGGTSYAFRMAPSDPDFPFDILALDCVLHIPAAYPKEGKPSLDVRNKEMGRGFQINVERGFARLAGTLTRSTLLGLMNALDKQLESLLTEQKAETITFVSNNASGTMAQQIGSIKPAEEVKTTTTNISRESKPQTIYTAEQRLIASERRERETRQLEARMGRLPLFSKSTDGIAYTIPITPREQASLPVPLQAVKTVKLFVPLLYPLQRCRIEILDVPRKAAMNTEKGFEKKVQDNSDTSLLGHVNYLAQNMRVLATEFSVEIVEEKDDLPGVSSLKVVDTAAQTHVDLAIPGKEERSHIKIIPRPPEWTSRPDDEASSGSEYSDSYDSGDEDEEDGGTALDTIEEKNTATAPERGISLSFPFLELYSIELLELVSLYLTIKCERCKDTMDISNLQTNVPRSETCSKCALHFSVVYRKELMHLNSVRAGYLDLDGCTVVDMLPSNFVPTCAECSTIYLPSGIVSVRGESSMAVCRECHRKMSFKIPQVRFLLVSAAARTDRAPVRKRPKEALGIVAGQPLARLGRCAHYSKSYRWFRFSCCSKVFACDKCHDAASDHPNEHANRMICGHCSREQNYRPEDCGICRATLIKKAGSGFWEGGKGTRDKRKMSRKDPRKYKRRPGGAARKIKAGGTGG